MASFQPTAKINMLVAILTHTPFFVWAILALLVYRGVAAMRERALTLRQFLVLPVAMTALSVAGLVTSAGGFAGVAAWAAGCGAALALTYVSAATASRPAAPGFIRVPGSVMPLVAVLCIFLIKYVSAVALHMHFDVDQHALLAPLLRGALGGCSGYFIGRALKIFLARKDSAADGSGTLHRTA